MRLKKAQAAMEYVIVLATLMLILGYVVYYVLYDAQKTMELTAAQDAVDSLAKAANTVYSLGPCSKTYVFVTIPGSAFGGSVGHNTILLKINTRAGESDVYALTIGNVTGYVPSSPKSYSIPVEMTCSGVLLVGGGFSVNPQEIRLNLTHGTLYTADLSLTNNRDLTISGITSSVSGDISGWTTISGLASSINSGATDAFTATFNIPLGTYTGAYSGTIVITGTDALIEVPVVIYVNGVIPTTTTTTTTTIIATTTTTTSSTTTTMVISTCNDYCVYVVGYTSGLCRENPSQCTANGEVNYGGGDVYCTGGPSQDTCCCKTTALTCNSYCISFGYGNGTCRQNPQQCANNGEIHLGGGDAYCGGGPPHDTCCCATTTTTTTTTSTTTTLASTTTTTTTSTTTTLSPCQEFYATTNSNNGANNPANVEGAPDSAYSVLPGNGDWVAGGGYPTGVGAIASVELAMQYHRFGTYVDDNIRLRYRVGSTYGTTVADYGDSVSDVTVYSNVTSDTNANGGSWSWSDISNMDVEARYVKTANEDNIDWHIDALWVRVCHA